MGNQGPIRVPLLTNLECLTISSNTSQHQPTKEKLKKNKINVTIRREFGGNIDAACGQLRAKGEVV